MRQFDRTIDVDGEYPFSVVGTVSTRPECQQLGFMHALMNAVDKECREKNLVFSLLTGQRQRYNFFGFEKAGFQYVFEFDDYFTKHHSSGDIKISKTLENELHFCYDLYQSFQIFNLRDEKTFFECMGDYRAKVFSIYSKNTQIGYFVLKKGQIIELYTNNFDVLSNIVNEILLFLNIDKLGLLSTLCTKNLPRSLTKLRNKQDLKTICTSRFIAWINLLKCC